MQPSTQPSSRACATGSQPGLYVKNWWYNEIGIPKTFGPAFIMLRDKLTPEDLNGAIAVMDKSRFGRTGQNKVWLAGNVLIKAILTDDHNLAKEARDSILSEITTGQPEGIKR